MKEENKIFPLSYNTNLKETEEMKVYYQYLDEIFGEPRICNIAISGGYGIGKSSILHSYDKKRQKEREEKKKSIRKKFCKKQVPSFLYISLGKYEKNDENCVNQEENDNVKEKNIIERRILLQIYTQFHKKDITAGKFPMVQEPIKYTKIKSIVGSLFITAIVLLILYKQISGLIEKIFSDNSLLMIHIVLYMFVFVVGIFVGRYLIYYMLTQMQLKNIAVKFDDTEVDIEKSGCEDYLDMYAMELVYCLEQIAGKVDRTVVFEDMDRLDAKACIEIFSRLREINFMVNQRLPKDKYIRFIYVIKDEVLSAMQQYKFFDYILPIVPRVNEKSSEDIFRENLKKLNRKLKFLSPSDQKAMLKMEQPGRNLIHIIAPYIEDYRRQYAILNDYGLFLKLFRANNKEELDTDGIEKILTLALYKNMWPEEYAKATSGHYLPELINSTNKNLEELKISLEEYKPQLLSYENLCYLGYSKQQLLWNIIETIKRKPEVNDKIEVIRHFPSDNIYVEAVQDFVRFEPPETEEGSKIDEVSELLAFCVKYSIENGSIETEFFWDSRDIVLCLKSIIRLDESDCQKFIQYTAREAWASKGRGYSNIFCRCFNVNQLAIDMGDKGKQIEADILMKGTNDIDNYNKVLYAFKEISKD